MSERLPSAIALYQILLPVAGLLVFFVPYQLTGAVATRVAPKRDSSPRRQAFAGAAILRSVVARNRNRICGWKGHNRAGDDAAGALPGTGCSSAIERESAVLDAVRAWWLLRRAHRDTRERLRRRRSELADLLDDMNRWLNRDANGQTADAQQGVEN